MCVCMYVWVFIYFCVHVCVSVYLCMCVFLCVSLYVCLYVCMYVPKAGEPRYDYEYFTDPIFMKFLIQSIGLKFQIFH